MRLARISTPHGPKHAVAVGKNWSVIKDLFADQMVATGETYPMSEVTLLAPVQPTVLVGIAHNDAGAGHGDLPQQAFLKSPRTVVGPGYPVRVNPERGPVVAEGELAVVISRDCFRIEPHEVPSHVLGFTIANDVTYSEQMAADSMMVQSKNGEGFTPLGPWIETSIENPDASELIVNVGYGIDETAVAGVVAGAERTTAPITKAEKREMVRLAREAGCPVSTEQLMEYAEKHQEDPSGVAACPVDHQNFKVDGEKPQFPMWGEALTANTSNLAYHAALCVSYVSQHVQLGAGDVVMLGSPSSSQQIAPRHTVKIQIPGIGTLENPVY